MVSHISLSTTPLVELWIVFCLDGFLISITKTFLLGDLPWGRCTRGRGFLKVYRIILILENIKFIKNGNSAMPTHRDVVSGVGKNMRGRRSLGEI